MNTPSKRVEISITIEENISLIIEIGGVNGGNRN